MAVMHDQEEKELLARLIKQDIARAKESSTDFVASDEEENVAPFAFQTFLEEPIAQPEKEAEVKTEETQAESAVDKEQMVPLKQFEEIQEQLRAIQHDIKVKLMLEEKSQAIIDTLHKELQMYKANEKQDQLLPFVKDIMMVIDDLEKKCRDYELNAVTDHEVLLKSLQFTIQDLEDVLYRQGIDSVPSELGQFNAKRHKIIATIKTTEPALDRQIARVHKKAFEWDGRLIRPEHVTVYVYENAMKDGGDGQ